MSQVWVERPCYYFWLRNAPCAYCLSLGDSFSTKLDDVSSVVGIYNLKSYPFRNTPVFNQFSKEERLLLQSDCFDGTNTPKFERIDDIPGHYFTVGTIELAYLAASPHDCLEISAQSLDLIKTFRSQGSTLALHEEDASENQLERDVPGWSLTYRVLDFLCLIHSFHYRKKPSRTIVYESTGFEFVRDDTTGILSIADSESSRSLSMTVNYSEHEGVPLETFFEDPSGSFSDGRVVMNKEGAPGPDETIDEESENTGKLYPLNPMWWTISEADFKCHLNTPCGCS